MGRGGAARSDALQEMRIIRKRTAWPSFFLWKRSSPPHPVDLDGDGIRDDKSNDGDCQHHQQC